jgi:hypothetical protein
MRVRKLTRIALAWLKKSVSIGSSHEALACFINRSAESQTGFQYAEADEVERTDETQ